MEGVELLISVKKWNVTGFDGFVYIVGQIIMFRSGKNIDKALSLLGCFGFVDNMISEGIYVCQPRDGYLRPHDFVDYVQAWRSRSQWRAGCCRL